MVSEIRLMPSFSSQALIVPFVLSSTVPSNRFPNHMCCTVEVDYKFLFI